MPKTAGVVNEPKWEHDGKDMSTAPKRPNPNPSGEWDWSKIKHRHVWLHDRADATREGRDKSTEGMSCNRVGCPTRREGPTCAAQTMGDGVWAGSRCTNMATVHDEKESLWSNTPAIVVDGVKGWWYCGVHDPEKARARDRIYRIKSAERDARWDQRNAEGSAQAELLREVARWRSDEAEVGDICDDLFCEHHACKLFRVATAYEALIAEGERMREEE